MKAIAIALLTTVLITSAPAAARTPATAARAPAKASAAMGQPPAQAATKRTEFLFATKDGQKLYLDVLEDPSVKTTAKRPVILYSFGGAWEIGSRSDKRFDGLFKTLTSMGYVVIPIDYRLGIRIAKERKEFTPQTTTEMYLRAIEWGTEDIFDATRFTLAHAEAWNIDKDKIILLGSSSGATNSLIAEYNVANETALAGKLLPAGFRYSAVIAMAGAFWLKAGTPLEFKNKPAPIMFFHGSKDQLVTYDEFQGHFAGYGPVAYSRKFAGPDYPKWFVDYPGGDHVIAALPATDSVNEIKAFLQKFVDERQQASIHMIEEDKVTKTFGNFLKARPGG